MNLLLVALAGGLGAWCRFRLDGLVKRVGPASWPLGTLVINVTGSFLLGLLAAFLIRGDPTGWGTVAGTGFLGGYTTFSAASIELVALLREGRRPTALLWGGGMVLLGFAAAALGLLLG